MKSERNIDLIISDEYKDYLVGKAYDDKYGARPLIRVVEKELEDKLSDEIIGNDLKNTAVTVILKNGLPEFIFTGG